MEARLVKNVILEAPLLVGGGVKGGGVKGGGVKGGDQPPFVKSRDSVAVNGSITASGLPPAPPGADTGAVGT